MPLTTQPSDAARKSINYFNKKNYRQILPPNAGKGRGKGTRNAVNQTVREMFQEFVYKNASTAQELYERVAKKDPKAALQILTNLADFVLPRLQRTEMSIAGAPLVSPNPISDASEAATVYATVLGNTQFDLTLVKFSPPAQAPGNSVVSVQEAAVTDGDAPGQETTVDPIDPLPSNVTSLWERLGK